MDRQALQLSVIIPTCGRPAILREVLGALRKQTLSQEFEIVVVNDGGTSEAAELANNFGARYYEQKRSGPATARNLGIHQAKGRVVLLLGDDTIPEERTLEEHLKVHQSRQGVAVVGLIDWHPSLLPSPFLDFLLQGGGQFSFYKMRDPEDAGYDFFYSSNLSLERRWLVEDKFDTSFPDAAFEDKELGYRLAKKGLRIVFRPEARVLHLHQYDMQSYLKRMRCVGRSAVHFLSRCPDLKIRLTYAPFTMIWGGYFMAEVYAGLLARFGLTERIRWKGQIMRAYLEGFRETFR